MTDQTSLDKRADDLISLVKKLNTGVAASNAAIAESNAAIAQSNERIADLTASNRRNKHVVRGLIASVAIDIILSVALGIVASSASNSADEATTASARATVASAQAKDAAAANKSNAHSLCVATNESRASAKIIWDTSLTINPATTAKQQKVTDDLLNLVAKTYAPRKC